MTPSPDDYARADEMARFVLEQGYDPGTAARDISRCFIATRKELAEARATLERVRGLLPVWRTNIALLAGVDGAAGVRGATTGCADALDLALKVDTTGKANAQEGRAALFHNEGEKP